MQIKIDDLNVQSQILLEGDVELGVIVLALTSLVHATESADESNPLDAIYKTAANMLSTFIAALEEIDFFDTPEIIET